MKRLCEIIAEVTTDALCSFTYFVKNNLITFANILNLIVPYVMYFAGQCAASNEIKTIGGKNGEILIPLMFYILIYYLRSAANKIGKGAVIPTPEKRFTEVDEDGEVSIEHKRLQELLLYVADLEDWMERKGML